ncbi:MAG TPA: hypothetical protein VEA16_21390, partial [Vicinamibacterales bacterium]|nr:hypothetical protein [Vicinamibacterales bacterium]
ATGTISTSGTLTGSAGTTVTLDQGNQIGSLGAFTSNGAFTLNDAGGGLNVTGTVVSGSSSVSIATAGGALGIGANITTGGGAGGTLTLTGVGVNQTAGAIVATGATTVNAGGGNVTLATPTNDFQAVFTLNGAATAAINDANTITFASPMTLSGSLTVTAAEIFVGDVTTNGFQQYNGNVTMASTYVTNNNAFTVTGTTTLNSDSTVNIGNSTATFGGAVNADANTGDGQERLTIINGGNVIFNGAVGNLQALGSLSTPTGTTRIDGGQVTTTGAQSYGGDVVLGASTTLTSTASGTISFAADVNAATAGGAALSVSTGDAINFAGDIGNINALSSIATMSVTTFTTSGSSVTTTGDQNFNGPLNGNNLTLTSGGNIGATDAANDLTGSLTASGANVSLRDANALTVSIDASQAASVTTGGTLTFGATNVGTNLTVSSNGAVTQTGALDVNGTTDIQAAGNSITLNAGGNDFTGAVTLNGGAIDIVDSNALSFGAVNATSMVVVTTGALDLGTMTAGSLNATTNGGNITQSGTALIAGTTDLSVGGGFILLDVPSNIFGDTVNAAGLGNMTIVTQGGLVIGTINAGSGVVTLTAGGDMTGATSGSLITAGAAELSSSGGSDQTVTGVGIVSPGNVFLTGTATLWAFTAGSSANPWGVQNDNIGVRVGGSQVFANTQDRLITGVVGAVAGAAAAAIVDEANRTFGTDSVAEDVEYGFAGEIGSTPPMDHRIDESGISLPRCVQESRDGVPCK